MIKALLLLFLSGFAHSQEVDENLETYRRLENLSRLVHEMRSGVPVLTSSPTYKGKPHFNGVIFEPGDTEQTIAPGEAHAVIAATQAVTTDCTIGYSTLTVYGSRFLIGFTGAMGDLTAAANNWGMCLLIDSTSAPGLNCSTTYGNSTLVIADEQDRTDVKPISWSYVVSGLSLGTHTITLTACETNAARFEPKTVNQFYAIRF